jgi:hypothetical protein
MLKATQHNANSRFDLEKSVAGAKKLAEVMELQGALAQTAQHPDGSSRRGANTAKMTKGRFGFLRGGDKHEPPTAAYAQV